MKRKLDHTWIENLTRHQLSLHSDEVVIVILHDNDRRGACTFSRQITISYEYEDPTAQNQCKE